MSHRMLAIAFVAIVAVWPTQAADDAAKSLKALDKQMGDVTGKIDKALSQMDKTMTSMDQVRRAEPSALNKRVPSFRKDVDKLTENLGEVRTEFVDMRGKGSEYFKKWDATNSSITDASLRSSAAERRNAAVQKHERLTDEMVSYRESVTKYMTDLTDLSKVLGADPSAIKSPAVLEKMDSLKTQYPDVRKGLQEARDKISNFRAGMPKS